MQFVYTEQACSPNPAARLSLEWVFSFLNTTIPKYAAVRAQRRCEPEDALFRSGLLDAEAKHRQDALCYRTVKRKRWIFSFKVKAQTSAI